MIDFHSHILPGIDDGSKNVEESIGLLTLLREQGVKKVAATSHYYADSESVEDFICKRQKAYDILLDNVDFDTPEIHMGAEVRYYEGISNLKNLDSLKIHGTNILLLEMPFRKWSEYSFKELISLSGMENLTILLAHIERYFPYVNEDVWKTLRDYNILMQVNASFFLNFKTRKKSIRMLQNHEIHLIGSDCHNLTSRSPRIGEAFERIEKKLGIETVNNINKFSESLFIK